MCWLCAAFGTSAAASAGLISSPEEPWGKQRGDCAFHELSWLSMKKEKDTGARNPGWDVEKALTRGVELQESIQEWVDDFMILETEARTHLLRLYLSTPCP